MDSESPSRGDRLMIVSVRPRFVNAILDGSKSVELRRTRPQVAVGQPVAIYATVPVASIVATARIKAVTIGAPSTVWEVVKEDAGVTRQHFRTYFAGIPTAVAIHLDEVRALESSVSLGDLRRNARFHPLSLIHI